MYILGHVKKGQYINSTIKTKFALSKMIMRSQKAFHWGITIENCLPEKIPTHLKDTNNKAVNKRTFIMSTQPVNIAIDREKKEYATNSCEESEEMETERCLSYYLKTWNYFYYKHIAGYLIGNMNL